MSDNGLLTNEEMSMLLNSGGDAPAAAAGGGGEKRKRVTSYNFRRPDRLSKEQVRSLYVLHDLFAHSMSSSLPVFLRAISELTLISVEQQAYVEYLYGLPDPTAIFTFGMEPLQGVAVLELNPSIAFPIIDRMLGGVGEQMEEVRPVTEIEQRILEGFLNIVMDGLAEAWRPIIEIRPRIVGSETRPQLLQIVSPNEVVITIVFHARIGEARGLMSLCIPAVVIEPIMQKFNQAIYSQIREIQPEQTRKLLDTLAAVLFPVAAEIRGTRAPISDLLTIAPGDVLMLGHKIKEPVQVSVGNIVKFRGEIAAHEGQVSVHLSSRVEKDELI